MNASARVVTWQRHGAIELRRGATTVIVVPELGMLIGSMVVDGFDHVARPGGLAAVRNGHTSAVPLLYPWANRLSRGSYTAVGQRVALTGLPLPTDGNGLAIHGTMVGRPGWEIVRLGSGTVTARFDFSESAELLASFPFPHEILVTVSARASGARVVTEVRAGPTGPVPVSFGWHPYWRLPGPRDGWTVELPLVNHARLDRRGIPTGRAQSEAAGPRALVGTEFDDAYGFAQDRRAELRGGGRSLRLDCDDGYPFLQVYAPAGGEFCCLEPMTAPTNALVTGAHPTVRGGDRFRAGFTVSVRSDRRGPVRPVDQVRGLAR